MVSFSALFPTAALALLVLGCSSTDAETTPTTAPFKLLTPSILGSGCKADTAWAEVSPDGQAVSILFSEFSANANGASTRKRRTCNFALPIQAAPGKSIGFYQVDFRGWAFVPPIKGASGTFANEYFFAGQRGPKVTKTYNASTDEPILESTSLQVQSVIWSPCGGSTNFRINSALTAVTRPGAKQEVQMQIDSLDATVNGQVQVFVASRDCSAKTTPNSLRQG